MVAWKHVYIHVHVYERRWLRSSALSPFQTSKQGLPQAWMVTLTDWI